MINQVRFQKLLNEALTKSKQVNPSTSIRSFAKRVGISSAAMSEILRGKRKVSRQMAEKILERLALNSDETSQVFSKSAGALEQLQCTHPQFEVLSEKRFSPISDWYYFAILSLTETNDFRSDEDWIAWRLNLPVSIIKEALSTLTREGLLRQDVMGNYITTNQSFATTDEIPSATIQQAHLQELALAGKAIENEPIDRRDNASITMAIDPAKLAAAKTLIREFRDRLCSLLETGPKSEVYKLNINLFPLSTKKPILGIILGLIVGFFASNYAQAGHATNNGGGTVVCRDSDNKILSVVFLDLWEAEKVLQYSIMNSNDLVAKQINRALDKIKNNPVLKAELIYWAHKMHDAIENDPKTFLPPKVRINPPKDADETFMGENCTLGSVASYDDTLEKLYVDPTAFSYLSATDRAALMVHESVYRLFRHWYRAPNSIGARRFTGCLFASQESCPSELLDTKNLNFVEGETSSLEDCESLKIKEDIIWRSYSPPQRSPTYRFILRKTPGFNVLQFYELYGRPLPALSRQRIVKEIDLTLGKEVQNYLGETKQFLETSKKIFRTTVPFHTKVGHDFKITIQTRDDLMGVIINDALALCKPIPLTHGS